MFRVLAPGLALLALCACSNGQNGGRRQVPPDKPSWITSTEDGRTRLAYGLPDSDAVALILDCAPHSGRVNVTAPLSPGASKLILASGRVIEEISGLAKADPEAGVDMVTGGAGARDAALSAFARTGRLVRVDPAGITALPASHEEQIVVRTFLDGCAQ